jgi:hypothetical protein
MLSNRQTILLWITICAVLSVGTVRASDFVWTDLSAFPHAELTLESQQKVQDYEVGLEALQKRLGEWGFRESLRVSGELERNTYAIIDGFDAREILNERVQLATQQSDVVTLFQCTGRDCGRAVQWANLVFGYRLLYGQENEQRYWIGAQLRQEGSRLFLGYSAFRTASRQYLHLETITVSDDDLLRGRIERDSLEP